MKVYKPMLKFIAAFLVFLPLVTSAASSTEHFNQPISSSSMFSWYTNSSTATGTANVSDSQAQDGKILRLSIAAGQTAYPGQGSNLVSRQMYHYGTYEARMKTANCASDEGVINGFFTYFNDGSDSNANGLPDNSEIDFEWLCAEPQSILMTIWTDYNDPTAISRRVYRKVNLATGTIEYTRYATTFGDSYTDLSNSPSENQPTAVQAISGYNSATNYYEYGFNWTASNVTLWVVNPSNGQKIVLWDYRGPSARIPKNPAAFMVNLWHHPNWTPECCANATNPPRATRSMDVDWLRFTPQSDIPSDTTAPSAPSNLQAPSKTHNSVNLSWNTATDNVGVVGYDIYQNGGANPVASTSSTTITISGLNPSTAYSFAVKARDAADNRSANSNSLSVSTNNQPTTGNGLQASFVKTSDWGNGYVGVYRITNNGSSAVDGWTLGFDLPSNATISSWWDATQAKSGNRYTAGNLAWNRRIEVGQTREFGFSGSYSGAWVNPSNCTINGQACSGGTTSTNVALGRPVQVSSVETSALGGANATDGNNATRWASSYSDPQWIQVDLGSSKSLTKVVLNWEAAYARAYQVQVSDDASTWRTLSTVSNGDGGTDTLNITGSGRYVRIYATQRGTEWGYSLWEIAAYN
ncbi:cellulose binding domain-containing protein [Herpetosiphon sp.]|uniref:Cellulose-binding family II n=1 Tax=Herpetosiphon aurantiacus (strain ATCC 23779 / DSM 785 / 114-95) TaxID=316274 RepID=A9AZK6_HERA2|nr:cellulose binding domain-containing protein [Herpetosiphon sp.]ABX05150.1 cellulose-binding family II [Herpetosiphon aurantiacus DSM 785]